MQSKAHPIMRVSVDGLTADGGLFEAKTTNWRLAEEWDDDQVADHAEVQVQHGLAVTGRSHAWVVVLIDGRDFRFRRVERDEALIATLIAMEEEFWAQYVLPGLAPAPEANALDTIKAQYALVERPTIETADPTRVRELLADRAEGKATEKAGKAQADVAEAGLRLLLGDAEVLTIDGAPAFTAKANGTFSPKRFEAEHPDVAAACTTTETVLDIDRLKSEHPDLYAQYRARVLRPVASKEK